LRVAKLRSMFDGKHSIVTGGSAGIGIETAHASSARAALVRLWPGDS
jgi:NAD(P)-dependent dehydrogenase (short-subunit alcohol dehydrogenase family)